MTDPLDIHAVMTRLREKRPVFHSEADFQHALCWQVHCEHPDAAVRLESRPIPGERLYLDCSILVGTRRIALELKYWTRRMEADVDGEHFQLADHAAQDVGRFLFLKDVTRIERFVQVGAAAVGYVIAITNEPLYWTAPQRLTRDAAFRLHEGNVLSGALDWPRDEKYPLPGTGYAGPLTVAGSYTAGWRPFSRVDAPAGEFRYIVVEVVPTVGTGGEGTL